MMPTRAAASHRPLICSDDEDAIPEEQELLDYSRAIGLDTLLDTNPEEALHAKEGIQRSVFIHGPSVGYHPFIFMLVQVAISQVKELARFLLKLTPSRDPISSQIIAMNGHIIPLQSLTYHLQYLDLIRLEFRQRIQRLPDHRSWISLVDSLASRLTPQAQIFLSYLIETSYFFIHEGVYSERLPLRCSIKEVLLEAMESHLGEINLLQPRDLDLLITTKNQLFMRAHHDTLLQSISLLPSDDLEKLSKLITSSKTANATGDFINDVLEFIRHCSQNRQLGVRESFERAIEQTLKVRRSN